MDISKYLNEHSIPAIIAVVFCVLLYLDSKMNAVERTGRDYVKSFIILYILAYLAIYLYNSAFNEKGGMRGGSVSDSTAGSQVGGGYYGSNLLRENIFVGAPNF